MLNWSASPTKKVKYKERKRKTEKQSESGATKGKTFGRRKKTAILSNSVRRRKVPTKY